LTATNDVQVKYLPPPPKVMGGYVCRRQWISQLNWPPINNEMTVTKERQKEGNYKTTLCIQHKNTAVHIQTVLTHK